LPARCKEHGTLLYYHALQKFRPIRCTISTVHNIKRTDT